jgi:hypothetical protein
MPDHHTLYIYECQVNSVDSGDKVGIADLSKVLENIIPDIDEPGQKLRRYWIYF